MKLMPHIKAFLDDLVNMCRTISVKRSDIAISYEGRLEHTNLYYQYKAIMDGTTTYYSYTKYPENVLRNILTWTETSSTYNEYVTKENTTRPLTGDTTITISSREPTRDDLRTLGDIWVKRNTNGQFLQLYKETIRQRRFEIVFKDSEDKEVNQGFILLSPDLEFAQFKLFLKNNKLNKFIEVSYSLSDEYVPKSSIESTDDLVGIGTNPDYEYFKYGKDYLSMSEAPYTYDMDKDGNILEYIYDQSIYDYRLKNDDDIGEIFYRRFLLDIERVLSEQSSGVVYLKIDDVVPYNYVRSDNQRYYKHPNLSNAYIAEEDINVDDSELEKTIEELSVNGVYYRYLNQKNNIIDFNETYTDNDTTLPVYDRQFYFSYNDGISVFECTMNSVPEDTSYDNFSYYMENKSGEYVYDGTKYIYLPESTDTKYSKFFTNNQNIYAKNPLGEYIPIKLTEYDDYTDLKYIYYCPNVTSYMATRLFSDMAINRLVNNQTVVKEEYRDIVVNAMNEYVKKEYCPYYGDPRWSVTRYDGEINSYYRELNGLPSIFMMQDQPKIDRRKINPAYKGDDVNPFVYDLSDEEIEIIENDGTLDKLKEMYPSRAYLWYLGKNRIDVLEAREAGPFDILRMGTYRNDVSFDIFRKAYATARDYIIQRHYQPEMFDVNEYYSAYVAMSILSLALTICMARSNDILIQNKYYDYETVQARLASFGFDHTFDKIPLVYRKNIAKNIELLIRNKGIDKIYELIYDIFNIHDFEVYKYYFRKVWSEQDGNYVVDSNGKPVYNLSIYQSPINSDNVTLDVINSRNKLDYDDITETDKYWGVYEPNENVKEKLLNHQFNYTESKYVTLNNKFNLSELNFNSSYLLNYIAECIGDKEFMIRLDGFEGEYDIKDLIIALFAIQSRKFGFDGNIPSDIVSTATILKFNVNNKVTGKGKDVSILDIIDKYYYWMSNNSKYVDANGISRVANRGKYHADELRERIKTIGAIITPNMMTKFSTHTLLDNIGEAYLKNLDIDNPITSTNENMFYNEVRTLRRNAKTISDYRCYSDLLKCIIHSESVRETYKLSTPVWEKIGSVIVSDEGKIDSYNWNYLDLDYLWTVINSNKDDIEAIEKHFVENNYLDSDGKLVIDENGVYEIMKDDSTVYVSYDLPSLSALSKNPNYVYAINIGKMTKSELMETDFIALFDTLKQYPDYSSPITFYKKDTVIDSNDVISDEYGEKFGYEKTIVNGNKLIVFNKVIDGVHKHISLDDYISDGNIQDINTYGIEIIKTNDGSYIVNVYQYLDIALTYEMYLKYESPELYKYIQKQDYEIADTTGADYKDRINSLYSTIIAAIDSAIMSNSLRDQLKIAFNDFENLVKYIKLVVEVFKSYTIDLASMDTIYEIDDPDNNKVKVIDDMWTYEYPFVYSNMNINTQCAIAEFTYLDDVAKIRDEIHIEEFYEVDGKVYRRQKFN